MTNRRSLRFFDASPLQLPLFFEQDERLDLAAERLIKGHERQLRCVGERGQVGIGPRLRRRLPAASQGAKASVETWRLLEQSDVLVLQPVVSSGGHARPEGFLLQSAASGQEALAVVEALKVPREDPATAHILIVALSANAMPRDIQKGLEAGFFRYLTKPIKVNEFMQTLDVALESAATILSTSQ